jgi:hypothetical protein
MKFTHNLPSRKREGIEGRACPSMRITGEGQPLPLTPSRTREGRE